MSKLEDLACTALQNHGGNIDAAAPKFIRAVVNANLLDELGRFYLQHVAVVGDWPGQQGVETHESGAGSTTAKSQPTAAAGDWPDDQSAIEAVRRAGSIIVKPHKVRQHRRRTQAEREAARRAMMMSADAIFEMRIEGRAIGGIAMGELRDMRQRLVHDATNKLILGAEQVHAAVLIEMIDEHCQVDDQLMRIRDAISAKDLKALDARAKIEAPRRIELAMAQAAIAMERHKELAA
jgi:hypothetical protein